MTCQYCKGTAELVDSKAIYGTSYGMIYLCSCGARVGTHKTTGKPLGILADASLRKLRTEFHYLFDPYWKDKSQTRSEAYQWLAEQLDMSLEECHGAKMNNEQITYAIEFLKAQL